MASLTFDEFHAIRSRQRAAADAKLRNKQEKDNEKQRRGTSSGRGVGSSSPPRRSVAVVPDGPGRGTTTSTKVTFSDDVGEEEEEEEVAPVSGSQDAIPATGEPIKNAAYQVKNKKGDDGDDIVSDLRRGNNRKGSERWGTLSSASSLGRFVELFEVQMTVVIVIYVDFFVSTVQLLPCMQAEALAGGEGRSASPWVVRLIVRLMESLTGFTTVLFAVELVLLLAAFRLRFFRHLGGETPRSSAGVASSEGREHAFGIGRPGPRRDEINSAGR